MLTKNVISNVVDANPGGGADAIGVLFQDDASFASGSVIGNSIALGATTYGIVVDPGAGTGNVDGTCNWWGSASGPGSVGPGSGSLVTANVDFTPWLATSSLSSTCAFATLTPAIGNAYGNQFVGTSSGTVTFTLHNVGTADLHVTTATLGSPNPGQFTISNDLCSGQTVAPAGTCTVKVAFAPTSVGAKTSSLDIASDATNGTVSVPLSGTGTARVSISPASNGFGNQRVGTVSAPVDFTVTNLDTVAVNVSDITFGLPNPGQFDLVSEDCTTGPIAASGHCTITVAFSPSSVGAKSTLVTVTSDGAPSTLTFNLDGHRRPAQRHRHAVEQGLRQRHQRCALRAHSPSPSPMTARRP